MENMISLQSFIAVVLYSCLGCITFAIAFKVLDVMTPNNLWHEILEEHNNALAIIVGAISIGLSILSVSVQIVFKINTYFWQNWFPSQKSSYTPLPCP